MIDRQNLKSARGALGGVAMTLAAVLSQSQPAAARQFDCRNAEAASERMICRNDTLGALDEQMSRLYGELMQAYDSREPAQGSTQLSAPFPRRPRRLRSRHELHKRRLPRSDQRFGSPSRKGVPPKRAMISAAALYRPRTSRRTSAKPTPVMPRFSAAPSDKSMTRPGLNGPRSLMRTTTLLPVSTRVTRTRVPNGSVRWAAVIAGRIEPFAGRRHFALSVVGGKAGHAVPGAGQAGAALSVQIVQARRRADRSMGDTHFERR